MSKKLLSIMLMLVVFILSSSIAFSEEVCSVDSSTCGVDVAEPDSIFGSKTNTLVDKIYAEHEEGHICVVYFYSETCSHCESIKPLINELEEKYSANIGITRIDVNSYEGFEIYNTYCGKKDYHKNEIPMIAISDKYYIGEDQIRDNLENKINELIENDLVVCPLEGIMTCHLDDDSGNKVIIGGFTKDGELSLAKTLPTILISGLVDGINPCAFAVLIFMMTVLLELSGSKKRVAKIGLAYIISFVATNVTLGLLVYWFSDLIFKGSPWPLRVATGIAIIAGVINIKDYFAYGKGFSLVIPKGTKKIVQKWINFASVPAAFILGIILAIFEAPCSASIYYTILEMLRNKSTTLGQALPYIIIYNLVFILPLVILFVMIYLGKSTHILDNWRKKERNKMKLAAGIMLLLLAAAIIFGWF